ncbi:hypothetical protein [Pseudomonas putida]|jgi:hypothetical protein|uniref:hypothetical protein n=1 Tax=Pseudomonas putida TaxID=303 RepID=UPI002363D088|nr:hypothetical protein [Pseudomonas putida]MDD2102982.1 hypothetical protein [Pseudomonas putida]
MAGGSGRSGISILLKARFLIEDFIEKIVKPKRKSISKAVSTAYSEDIANQVAQDFVLSALEHLSAISHYIESQEEGGQVNKKTFEALLALDQLSCDLCNKLIGTERPKN